MLSTITIILIAAIWFFVGFVSAFIIFAKWIVGTIRVVPSQFGVLDIEFNSEQDKFKLLTNKYVIFKIRKINNSYNEVN